MLTTLAEVQKCLRTPPEKAFKSIAVNNVQTDSRAVQRGDVFFCIEGENLDGHEFAAQAARAGAAAVVTHRLIDDPGVPVLMVRNTREALGRLAACWRALCGARLVAVTGTAGKTSVKEMLAEVCSEAYSVARNYRNFNTQIGLPMSMLKAREDQDLWVMEAGISHLGDMDDLGPVANPDIAVITNVGPGHLEGLGDIENVAKSKASLLRFLRPKGKAVVSADYPELLAAVRQYTKFPIMFSTRDAAMPYYATFLGPEADGSGRYKLRTPNGEREFTAPFCGEHYAENTAAVAAAAQALELTLDEVVEGLKRFRTDSQRFCCTATGGVCVINDTYNANPLSMSHAIRTAQVMADGRPLVLVLGDMRELGSEAEQRHRELGELLREIDPKAVFYKGDHAADVTEGFGAGRLVRANDPDSFIKAWRNMGLEKAVVLFKGSRSMRMEEFANALNRELGSNGGAA